MVDGVFTGFVFAGLSPQHVRSGAFSAAEQQLASCAAGRQQELLRERASCARNFFIQQQQVCDALRSGAQPQMSQSPEHSPVIAWARMGDLRARGARGLRTIAA
jgi:hypothetical protein